jgi:hypothetical protein
MEAYPFTFNPNFRRRSRRPRRVRIFLVINFVLFVVMFDFFIWLRLRRTRFLALQGLSMID